MKVFLFDLVPYDEHFDQFTDLPYPLPGKYFKPEVARQTYQNHIEAWKLMDQLGFDGVGFNEHHTTPHGLMNSPNMMIAVASQHTKNLKFVVMGHLLPMHNPLLVAEETAMADILSNGRVIAGFARGAPREYHVFSMPAAEARARFEESFEIIMKAWTEESFSYEGQFWSFKDISIWPRPMQQPHPPVWIPVTGSKETLDWAGERGFPIALPEFSRGLIEDIVGYYSRAMARKGHRVTPDHMTLFADAYVADSREKAIAEYGPYYVYFQNTLFGHGNSVALARLGSARNAASFDYVRPENKAALAGDRVKTKAFTIEDAAARVADRTAWGSPKEVIERLIDEGEHAGANNLLLNVNLGAMPHEMFMEQIRRFGTEVLPALHAHDVKRVRPAEMVGVA
jgi:alkanesulfonate monooxygenase SsuD/methylene tetrahydromethanopterin reductase-like flavin-dependent oxidoreductase (luciferase family)